MKVLYQGKEIELDTSMEKGKKELDKITEEEITNDLIDMEDTIEITEEMLKEIKQGEENEG
ncbi:MAG: hypothetical protein IKE70_03000 [Bacilli bacterium]|nr:hypothetical protein [Bacilli bacterium]